MQKKNDYSLALKAYRKALQIQPNKYEVWQNIGTICIKKRDFDQALKAFKKAIEIKPDNYDAWQKTGVVYMKKQDFDQAIKVFQKVIELKPDSYGDWYNLGNASYEKGQLSIAIEAYQKALDIKQDFQEALIGLGNAYAEMGDFNLAFTIFEEASAIKPDEGNIYGNWGFALFKQKKLVEAEQMLLKGILNGSINFGNMNLGHVYLVKNEREKALDCYRKSINSFDEAEEFWQGIRGDFKYLAQYGVTRNQFDEILADIAKTTEV